MKNSSQEQPQHSQRRTPLFRRLVTGIVSLFTLCAIFGFGMTLNAYAAVPSGIIPGGSWTDTSGNSLQAHGAGLIKVGSTYYWFGEDRTQNNVSYVAISCYASTDLVHWTFRNHAPG